MTWAKLDDRFHGDPTLLRLPRGVRLLYVEALTWSCQHGTDGLIERHVLCKVTDEPDAPEAAGQLVEAGLWAVEGDHWRVVDYAKTQSTKAEIDAGRADSLFRAERSKRHRGGDHRLCSAGSSVCPQGELDPRADEVARATAVATARATAPAVAASTPTLSDPTPREGKEKGSSGPTGSATATPAARRPIKKNADGGFTIGLAS